MLYNATFKIIYFKSRIIIFNNIIIKYVLYSYTCNKMTESYRLQESTICRPIEIIVIKNNNSIGIIYSYIVVCGNYF